MVAMRLMHIFTETTTSDECSGWSPGNDDEVSHNLQIFLLYGLEVLKAYILKKGFILQSKGAHFEKNSPQHFPRRNYFTLFPPRFARYSTLQICFLRPCYITVQASSVCLYSDTYLTLYLTVHRQHSDQP